MNQLISIKEAVDAIVKAQRQNIREISIPTYWLYVNSLLRYIDNIILQISHLITYFFISGVCHLHVEKICAIF